MQVCIKQPEQSTHAFSTSEELLHNATGGVAQVFRYWDRLRGARLMPSPSEVDFLELRPWLAGIMMVEVTGGEGRELIYRVVGERAVRLRGYDPTGMTVSKAAFGQSVAYVLANYSVVIDLRIPLYGWYDDEIADGRRVGSGTLLLPLSGDGRRVDWVLVYIEDTAAYDWTWAR
ncbi:PAS domain-containing protein [Dongia deserti]|uniref:PAS domain-containing protein n=1 Tax=Dongia deserti TaxID=2268030 RepID=UPI0013C43522|nr:PAS domain-containing protein [Dongia deserti]